MVLTKFLIRGKGQYISRVDGHTVYPETYFRDAIKNHKIIY